MSEQVNFNDYKFKITNTDIEQILDIVAYRCRLKTYNRLRSILTYGKHTIPNFGILNRLTKEDGKWSYCAGQSYPDEIKTVRDIILKGA